MKVQIKITLITILLVVLLFSLTPSAYAAEEVVYGVNNYDKVYVNDKGIMALSKGDLFKIDGENKEHYYTMTKSGNTFYVPKHRIEKLDLSNPIFTAGFIEKKFQRQSKMTNLIGFSYLQLGKPYLWGGKGLVAFDCSSLMQESYKTIGHAIPRTSRIQSEFGKFINPTDLQIGDLLFFKGSSGQVSHVGMYIGEGQFIHASNSKGSVVISSVVEGYYKTHIVGARRIIE